MAFVNEFVPPLEKETSDFFRKARVELRTGYNTRDKWTVDRENEMVLCRQGGGHSIEAHNHDYWSFIDHKGSYDAITKLLAKKEISAHEVAITRSISFQTGRSSIYPDKETKARIKDALREYKDLGASSTYKEGRLMLIDELTGEEI